MKFASAYDKKEIDDINVKYIIELDRKGCNDMVFYGCDNPEFENYIGKFGWDSRFGTYSDICSIAPTIGVAAVNLSSGYYKAHTTEEIINIDDVMTNIKRVRKMIKASVKDEVPSFKYIEDRFAFDYKEYGNYKNKTVASGSASVTATAPSKTITMETVENKKEDNTDGTKQTEPETVNKTPEKPIGFWDYCKLMKISTTAENAQDEYVTYLKIQGLMLLPNR